MFQSKNIVRYSSKHLIKKNFQMTSQHTLSNDVTKHYNMNKTYQKVGEKNFWVEFTGGLVNLRKKS